MKGSLSSFGVIECHKPQPHPSHLASRVHALAIAMALVMQMSDNRSPQIEDLKDRIDRSARQAENKSWRRCQRTSPEHASSESAANQNSQRDVGGGARGLHQNLLLDGRSGTRGRVSHGQSESSPNPRLTISLLLLARVCDSGSGGCIVECCFARIPGWPSGRPSHPSMHTIIMPDARRRP